MPHFLWAAECYTSAKCELIEIHGAQFILAEIALMLNEIELVLFLTL